MYIYVYIYLCAESGDLSLKQRSLIQGQNSKSRLRSAQISGQGRRWKKGAKNDVFATVCGAMSFFCTGAAKTNDFEAKFEFRSRFCKLAANLCAQARRFRRIRQKRRVYDVFGQTV